MLFVVNWNVNVIIMIRRRWGPVRPDLLYGGGLCPVLRCVSCIVSNWRGRCAQLRLWSVSILFVLAICLRLKEGQRHASCVMWQLLDRRPLAKPFYKHCFQFGPDCLKLLYGHLLWLSVAKRSECQIRLLSITKSRRIPKECLIEIVNWIELL